MILWKTKNFLSLVQTTVHLSNAEAKHRYTGKKWFRFLWKQRGQIELGFSWHNKRYWWSYTNFFSESGCCFFFYIGGGPYLSGCCVWWTCFRKNIIWWNNYDWAKRLRRNLDSCIHFFFSSLSSACLFMEQLNLGNTWSVMEGLEMLCCSEGKFNFFRHRIPLERPEITLNGFNILFSPALWLRLGFFVASFLQVECEI